MDFTCPINVRFECNRCGLCCGDTKQKSRHILLLETEAKKIASENSKLLNEFSTEINDKLPYRFEMKKTNEGKCVFLKENQCTIYSFRPLICIFYPFELKFDDFKILHVFSFTTECPTLGMGGSFGEKEFKRLFELAKERLLKVDGEHQAVPK